MNVKKLDNPKMISELIQLLLENDKHVYDCNKDTYINSIVKNMYSKNHIVWIMYEENKPVGYLYARYNNNLNHEIMVLDAFVLPSHQGKRLLMNLLRPLIDLSIKLKVKRVKWESSEVPEFVWLRNIFETKVKETRVYSVNIENNTKIYQEQKNEINKQ